MYTALRMPVSDTISIQLERRSREARAQAFLYLILRADVPSNPGLRIRLGDLDRVELRRGRTTRASVEDGGASLELADPGVSGNHARLSKSAGRWTIEDLGSKNGSLINGERLASPAALSDGDLIEVGHSFLLFRDAVPAPSKTIVVLESAELVAAAPGLATFSPGLAENFDQLRAVASSSIPVVIGGETGTGKEVIASTIHKLSGRPGTFQAVNCGALAPNLVETELFGYRKGAFSGADEDRPGLVRSADRGTLFLDEFGDLPLAAQATLLRVLQEAEVTPVGGTRAVKVDLRVIVATHRNLDALVATEKLRADLFARVSGFSLVLPPLRERREDLGLLIDSLLRRHRPEQVVAFSPDAMRALLLYGWPLNIRELDKVLATALALSQGSRIELRHLSLAVRDALEVEKPAELSSPEPLSEEDQRLRAQLETLLRQHRGNVTAVAQTIGKFRNQVQRWLKRLGLDPTDYRR
jgi:DNA-binding NtrC family response regulator